MKISEFKRYLEKMGVEVKNGTRHWLLKYNGKRSTLLRHPTKEIDPRYAKKILKDLLT